MGGRKGKQPAANKKRKTKGVSGNPAKRAQIAASAQAAAPEQAAPAFDEFGLPTAGTVPAGQAVPPEAGVHPPPNPPPWPMRVGTRPPLGQQATAHRDQRLRGRGDSQVAPRFPPCNAAGKFSRRPPRKAGPF